VEKFGTARQATGDNVIRNMHFACRIKTHAQIYNTAFPQQKLLLERASVVRYTYIACRVLVSSVTTARFILCCKRGFNV
jgi:hypothetical protein